MSDSKENLRGQGALEKIKEIVNHAKSCQMLTALDQRPISARPMGVQEVEESGSLLFFSHKGSTKNREINASKEVQLIFSNDSNLEYMSLFGDAEIFRDQQVIDRLYNSIANNWFEGKDDPNITIIRFTPAKGTYSDTKNGKAIQFAGMLIGAITGENASNGVQGEITI